MRPVKILTYLIIAILAAAFLFSCAGQEPDSAEDFITKQVVPKEEKPEDIKEDIEPPLTQKEPEVKEEIVDDNDEAIDTDDEYEINEPEDGIYDSVKWLSYLMDIEVTESAPNDTDIIPDGKFVHVILTYISDDDGLEGFLFDDLVDPASFVIMDTSGNVYEHLSIFSPIRINISNDTFEMAEIQPVLGVFFDIPIDVRINELTFSTTS